MTSSKGSRSEKQHIFRRFSIACFVRSRFLQKANVGVLMLDIHVNNLHYGIPLFLMMSDTITLEFDGKKYPIYKSIYGEPITPHSKAEYLDFLLDEETSRKVSELIQNYEFNQM